MFTPFELHIHVICPFKVFWFVYSFYINVLWSPYTYHMCYHISLLWFAFILLFCFLFVCFWSKIHSKVFKLTKISLIWKLVQHGRVEDVHSLPLARAPDSQLTAEQSSTGRHWNSPKKIPHIQRQRRSCNEMVGGAQSQ